MFIKQQVIALFLLGFLAISALPVRAEPYFAVRTGNKCSTCHVNPTGGGKRTEYGNVYAQTQLITRYLGEMDDAESASPGLWTGRVHPILAIGGDLRADFKFEDIADNSNRNEFDLQEALVYLELDLVPGVFTLYVDERLGPDSAFTREAWGLYSFAENFYLKGGRFFLPFGLRLEDDTAFIREASGIDFNTPDEGVELGFEKGAWSTAFAVTNGNPSGTEIDEEKRVSALAAYVKPRWRVGVSASVNSSDNGDRVMQSVFAGFRSGKVTWLAELDYIEDDVQSPVEVKQWAGLLEANIELMRGHNLKLSYEGFEPDDDREDDLQQRFSIVWEYFPFQFTQLRAGLRFRNSDTDDPFENSDLLFIQMHAYF